MAADNKNQSASDNNEKLSITEMGGGENSSTFRPRLKLAINRKFFIVLGVALLVFIVLYFGLHVGQKIYAQAAGHKIYKSDIENLIGDNKKIKEHDAATVLADKYLTEAMAKDQGLSIDDQDIEAAYGSAINDQKKNDKYSYQLQVNQLYFNKLQAYNQGIYKGNLLVAHFSRYIPFKPLTAEQQAAIPKFGNPGAIAEDKQYAQTLISNLYSQIRSGKLTFKQASQVERNDPRVGTSMYPALTHSGPFDTSKNPNPLLNTSSIRKKISSIKPGQTTKPFVVRVSGSTNPNIVNPFESYFLVVKMDASLGGHGDPNFQKYLTEAKKDLGYAVNI